MCTKVKICDLTVNEFHAFNQYTYGRYKDIGIIRYFFIAVAGVRRMYKIFGGSLSEEAAVDDLIDVAVAYREYMKAEKAEKEKTLSGLLNEEY